ncbi:hypothetical protein GS399_05290 [Pedobacter sp. HMF7647]|uniref:Uncharacterized protein n=1 Tax=Hufsiella arboris TaxID=2695275 RepID=A0A7K1Y8H3_9SPHI|nr:hypothetical protein [Hufsiella arboris]MXV50379.1 hypothetical protein [Hufsiella arboris]
MKKNRRHAGLGYELPIRAFAMIIAAVNFLVFLSCPARAQVSSYQFEENVLAPGPGTSVISDVTASGGSAFKRLSGAGTNTFWFGPYAHLKGGSYVLNVRLKVQSNSSPDYLFTIDIVSSLGGAMYGHLYITPNMFANPDTWQVFSIPFSIPDNIENLEIRGVGFIGGITDASMDYVQVVPGDSRGFYSDDFTITGLGNVGIGTSVPKEKLSVNGRIRAREVKVEVENWPDYVFGDDYKKLPLEDLQSYILKNKHLPEVPSAGNISAEGIDLGAMNAVLLKKIEELALYLIEKEQEIKELKDQRNSDQVWKRDAEKRLSDLEKKIDKQ